MLTWKISIKCSKLQLPNLKTINFIYYRKGFQFVPWIHLLYVGTCPFSGNSRFLIFFLQLFQTLPVKYSLDYRNVSCVHVCVGVWVEGGGELK